MRMEGIIVLCAVVVLAALVVAHPQREHHGHHGNAGHQERQQNSRGSRVQYDSFDDYLLDVVAPVQFNEVPEDAAESNGDAAQRNQTSPAISDIIGYFRDVPREHWSCCMLGKLAGDKGFHCHPGFYAARIQSRNYNRAHNRRMPLMHGAVRVESWGMDIMRTFQRCVLQHSAEFHKCCYAATVERREILRWQRFREPAQ